MKTENFDKKEGVKSDVHTSATAARENLMQQALILYQCPDGSLVTHPSQCKEQKTGGGYLDMTDVFKLG